MIQHAWSLLTVLSNLTLKQLAPNCHHHLYNYEPFWRHEQINDQCNLWRIPQIEQYLPPNDIASFMKS